MLNFPTDQTRYLRLLRGFADRQRDERVPKTARLLVYRGQTPRGSTSNYMECKLVWSACGSRGAGMDALCIFSLAQMPVGKKSCRAPWGKFTLSGLARPSNSWDTSKTTLGSMDCTVMIPLTFHACKRLHLRSRIKRASDKIMVQFTLPKNSKVRVGKTWPKPEGATHVRKFSIYRWSPDDGENPRVDTYFKIWIVADQWFWTL